ncbi:diguanylate cyclase (GGDEF)-like protein/PAS domain S-box-containing protein [Bacillus mesophilus]|uniref:Diguanylate cyclase n=1 Tax=Bacillus mesophilus TaxID=1808955 RepID=A0A6M0QDS2_9BACI|nr:diguanylate cyclase [Bacillus mesophilus]MBM7660095.1 diguanylate cyclase (GGDEF)-like protein/PAS domain S-box-containing protein [Bacillus mesophilus]NEY73750.1 diguanylate cyclase [Bacillus mesophilus]
MIPTTKTLFPEYFTSKYELELIWNNTNDAIFLIAPNGAILKANPSFESLLGYSGQELFNAPIPPFIPDHLIKQQKPFLDKMRKGERLHYFETQRVTKDGRLIEIVSSYCPVLDENNDLLLIVGMYKDVTKQVEAQRLLAENEKKYRFIAENTSDLIQVLDEYGVISYISPSVQSLLNFAPSNYINKYIAECLFRDDVPQFIEHLHQLQTTEVPFKTEVRYLKENGDYVWMEVKASYVLDNQERKTMVVSRDISDRKKYEEELKYLAFHDTLTGLPNRYQFTELLKEEMTLSKSSNQAMALMYVDIDNFKQINDSLGHSAGDHVLKEFSIKLKKSVRESDKVCRISGDEFIVILAAPSSTEAAIMITEKIQKELSSPVHIGEDHVYVHSSIGIALYNGEELSSENLIKRADFALYQTKENQKGSYTIWENPRV